MSSFRRRRRATASRSRASPRETSAIAWRRRWRRRTVLRSSSAAICPALTPDHLRDCAESLCDGIDAAVIPAEDGGYVLLGTRRPHAHLFADMPWGTALVMGETRSRLARLSLAWREPARLWDLDRPEDLARLAEIDLA